MRHSMRRLTYAVSPFSLNSAKNLIFLHEKRNGVRRRRVHRRCL